MKPYHKKNGNLIQILWRSSLILSLIFSFSTCKTPTTPKDGEADIIILNRYGESLNIHMNGNFLWVLDDLQDVEIDNVAQGKYTFEARKIDDSRIVNTAEIKVAERTDYYWEIGDPADINIVNSSGLALQIFMDGTYQFELQDGLSREIPDVSHGEHFVKAVRSDNGLDYASITMDIQRDQDYTWTIQ
jgi:hypothetical protein